MSLCWVEVEPPPGGRAVCAETPRDTVVYAIGDIHGCYDLLEAIQQGIAADSRQRSARRRVVVYLGDYVSRGPDSRRVVELLSKERAKAGMAVMLKGNHEDLLLRYLDGELEAGRRWFNYGGLDTLAHYGVEPEDRKAQDDQTLEALRQRFAEALPQDHLAFFRSLLVSHSEGGYRFVHAGIRPGVLLSEQNDHDQMWIRKRFLDSDEDHGAVVIHGHSISPLPQLRHNRIGIDTGAYASGVLTCLVLEGDRRAFLQTRPDRR